MTIPQTAIHSKKEYAFLNAIYDQHDDITINDKVKKISVEEIKTAEKAKIGTKKKLFIVAGIMIGIGMVLLLGAVPTFAVLNPIIASVIAVSAITSLLVGTILGISGLARKNEDLVLFEEPPVDATDEESNSIPENEQYDATLPAKSDFKPRVPPLKQAPQNPVHLNYEARRSSYNQEEDSSVWIKGV